MGEAINIHGGASKLRTEYMHTSLVDMNHPTAAESTHVWLSRLSTLFPSFACSIDQP